MVDADVFDPTPGEARCLALIRHRESNSCYDALCGGGKFASYKTFPQWPGYEGSHAAGAYQFEPETWAWIAGQLGLLSFAPSHQDIAALWLLRRVGPNSTESWAASGPYPTPLELA